MGFGSSNTERHQVDQALCLSSRLRSSVIQRVLVSLPEVHGARPERVGGPTRDADATLQLAKLRAKIGPALDHLLGRVPIRPFLLVVDDRSAGPGEAFLAHAHPVAHGAPTLFDEVEVAGAGVDDDCPRLLVRGVSDAGAQKRRVDSRQRRGGYRETLARDRPIGRGPYEWLLKNRSTSPLLRHLRARVHRDGPDASTNR